MLKKKELLVDRFSKAQATYDDNALAQKMIACRLCDLVSGAAPEDCTWKSMFEVGCGTGLLTRIILSRFAFETVHINDISDAFVPLFSDLNKRYNYGFYVEDAEEIVLNRKYDLIISSSVFQWFNDVPSFLEKTGRHLYPGGIFAFSTFGQENMREIKTLTGTGLDYFSTEKWRELLSVHFEIVHVEEETIELQLNSPKDVLTHLKQTGVNALKNQSGVWTPSKIRQFENTYRNLFSNGEKVKLTYHPLYFITKLKTQ